MDIPQERGGKGEPVGRRNLIPFSWGRERGYGSGTDDFIPRKAGRLYLKRDASRKTRSVLRGKGA